MATAQQMIEAAIARSTANDAGKLAVDGEMLGVLDRLFQLFYSLLAIASPDAHMARADLAALAGTPASATLPTDCIDLRRVIAKSGSITAGAKIRLMPVEEVDRTWHLAPCVYRQGNSIVSRGAAGDPVAGDVLTAFVLDVPATLAALGTSIDSRFPVRHHELLVVWLALYLDSKDQGRDAGEHAKLMEQAKMLTTAFFTLAGLSMTALETPHGGVIIQRLNSIVSGKPA